MPKETDPKRLEILRWALAHPAHLYFRKKAFDGGERSDEGALNLLPGAREVPRQALRELLRTALLDFISAGDQPNRVEVPGDSARGEPATFYEFRLTIEAENLYVKTELIQGSLGPDLVVMSVKRQY